MSKPFSARRTAVLGLCCALAAALSYIEGFLPALPIPGARLGLSNIVVMLVLATQGVSAGISVTVVKAGFAFLRGGTAGLFSLVGGTLSTLVTAALLCGKRRPLGWIGVGVCGALMHNVGQLAVAMVLTSPALLYYAPWLALISTVTGTLTGVTARCLVPVLLPSTPPPKGAR